MLMNFWEEKVEWTFYAIYNIKYLAKASNGVQWLQKIG